MLSSATGPTDDILMDVQDQMPKIKAIAGDFKKISAQTQFIIPHTHINPFSF